jgi:hypothetical protein
MKKLLKIQYLLHLGSKNLQSTFIKSYSLRTFQQYEDGTQIPV